jgi:aryl-alcohol dehydrogenase-like predicted oxidoreductase
VEPIEIAIAYVVHTSSLVFPLIGPRTINELNSSIFGSQIDLSEEELSRLSID